MVRLGSGMRVSARFQLHGGGGGGWGNVLHRIKRRGNCPGGKMSGGEYVRGGMSRGKYPTFSELLQSAYSTDGGNTAMSSIH